MNCAKGYQVLVTKSQKTWLQGENYCQAEGGHLVSPAQLRTCEPVIMPMIGNAEVYTSYTRLLDGLHFRDIGADLITDDLGIKVRGGESNCSVANLGEPTLLKDKACNAEVPVVCVRTTGKILLFV